MSNLRSHQDRIEQQWQDHLQRAVDYQTAHGNLLGLWHTDQQTMRWIQNQRVAEERGRLRNDRRQQLDRLLPDWREDHRTYAVRRYVHHVQQWLADNPGATVADIRRRDKLEVDGEVINLGRQTSHYRTRRRQGLLDDAIREILDELEWPDPT